MHSLLFSHISLFNFVTICWNKLARICCICLKQLCPMYVVEVDQIKSKSMLHTFVSGLQILSSYLVANAHVRFLALFTVAHLPPHFKIKLWASLRTAKWDNNVEWRGRFICYFATQKPSFGIKCRFLNLCIATANHSFWSHSALSFGQRELVSEIRYRVCSLFRGSIGMRCYTTCLMCPKWFKAG